MGTTSKGIAITVLALLAAPAFAEDQAVGRDENRGVCLIGDAISYTIVCDPGSRTAAETIFPTRESGVALCRIQSLRCSPVFGRSDAERPGLTVRDATKGGELVGVIFGLERLLGEAPDQRR